MEDGPPPPPPPPHGENPQDTSGAHGGGGPRRRGDGLPDGNYDIFIVPPHSSGGGFIYFPSLQPHRNSFIAGSICTLLVIGVWTLVFPVMKEWFLMVVASGGAGVALMLICVGGAAWAIGRTGFDSSDGPSAGRQKTPGGSGSGSGSGSTGGRPDSRQYGRSYSSAHSGPNARPGFDPGGPPPGTPPRGGAQYGDSFRGSQYGGNAQYHAHDGFTENNAPPPPPPPPPPPQPPEPEPEREPKVDPNEEKKKQWEKQREEIRRKNEQRKKEEEAKRRLDEYRKRKQEEADAKKRQQEQEEQEKQQQREKEQKERDQRERRERFQREREEREKRAREEREKQIRERIEARERELKEKEKEQEREKEREKEALEKEAKEKAEREAREKELREAREREAKEREERASRSTASQSPSKKSNFRHATAHTEADPEEMYSFRPYDKPKKKAPRTVYTSTSASSFAASSYAASESTSRTTPPPMNREGMYRSADPDAIVIKGAYAFNNLNGTKPMAELIAGIGNVSIGLILRITTEGMFIDDEGRGSPQREWDTKAWTLKMVETGTFRDVHLIRTNIRDVDGRKFVFVYSDQEAKAKEGLQRLRKGPQSQTRGLNVSMLDTKETKAILEQTGWIW